MRQVFVGAAALTLMLVVSETASAQWGGGYRGGYGSGFGVSYGTRVGNSGYLRFGYNTAYPGWNYGYRGVRYATPRYYGRPAVVYPRGYYAPRYGYSYRPVYRR